MRLVIGTRRYLGPEWVHVDIDPRPLFSESGEQFPVDVVGDARSVPLPDGCAEYVYTQECLEHFPWRETRTVLAEWVRLLSPGGVLRVEVPDFLAACQEVLDHDSEYMDFAIQQIIFGGQENEFDFHYTGLTPRMLTKHMTELGLTVEHIARSYEVGYLQVDGRKN